MCFWPGGDSFFLFPTTSTAISIANQSVALQLSSRKNRDLKQRFKATPFKYTTAPRCTTTTAIMNVQVNLRCCPYFRHKLPTDSSQTSPVDDGERREGVRNGHRGHCDLLQTCQHNASWKIGCNKVRRLTEIKLLFLCLGSELHV